jgi:hypothetical protein
LLFGVVLMVVGGLGLHGRGVFGLSLGVFVGGLLGVVCGFLEVLCGYLVVYGGFLVGRVEGGPGGAGLAFLMYLSIPAGLLFLAGGALVLFRRYLAGGLVLLVSGVVFPFRMASMVLWLALGLPYPTVTLAWQVAILVFGFLFLAMPVAGGVLALVYGVWRVK